MNPRAALLWAQPHQSESVQPPQRLIAAPRSAARRPAGRGDHSPLALAECLLLVSSERWARAAAKSGPPGFEHRPRHRPVLGPIEHRAAMPPAWTPHWSTSRVVCRPPARAPWVQTRGPLVLDRL